MHSVADLHSLTIENTKYRLRTPDVYDPAKARRVLARQRVRRPSSAEIRVAALKGIEALGEQVGDPEEGTRQRALLEEWYQLSEPVNEDDIDEPDLMKRGEELLVRETERRNRVAAIYADVMAIEANLERHWGPYADLQADRNYWEDVSRIEVVRLLLVDIDGVEVPRDEDGLMLPSAFREVPATHRFPLATKAFSLMSPTGEQSKN